MKKSHNQIELKLIELYIFRLFCVGVEYERLHVRSSSHLQLECVVGMNCPYFFSFLKIPNLISDVVALLTSTVFGDSKCHSAGKLSYKIEKKKIKKARRKCLGPLAA